MWGGASGRGSADLRGSGGAAKIGRGASNVDADLTEAEGKLAEISTPGDFSLVKNITTKIPKTFGVGVNESSSLSANYNYSKVGNLGWFSSTPEDNWGWLADATEEEWVEIRLPTGVVIGDSIAEGHPGEHGRLHQSYGDPTFNSAMANEPGQPSYELAQRTGFFWWNHGIGGETTAQIWNRWPRDALGQTYDAGDGRPTSTLLEKPIWIWVNAGINDVSALIDTEVTKANLLSMALSAKENGIYIGFNTIGPIDSHDSTQRAMQDEINAFILDVLPQFGAYTFDYHEFMKAPLDPTQLLDDLHADGVHPNRRGYAALVAKLVTESDAPIFLESITLESKADQDTVPTDLVNVIRAQVFDKNLDDGIEAIFKNNVAKISPRFDLTNTATIRIYITEVEGGPNAAKYAGLSRVYCTFGKGGAKEKPQNQMMDAVISKQSGTWGVINSLSKGRGIVSVAQSSTQITITTDFSVNTATVSMAGVTAPHLYTVSYSARNQKSVFVRLIDPATLLPVDPTAVTDGAAFTIQAARSK